MQAAAQGSRAGTGRGKGRASKRGLPSGLLLFITMWVREWAVKVEEHTCATHGCPGIGNSSALDGAVIRLLLFLRGEGFSRHAPLDTAGRRGGQSLLGTPPFQNSPDRSRMATSTQMGLPATMTPAISFPKSLLLVTQPESRTSVGSDAPLCEKDGPILRPKEAVLECTLLRKARGPVGEKASAPPAPDRARIAHPSETFLKDILVLLLLIQCK